MQKQVIHARVEQTTINQIDAWAKHMLRTRSSMIGFIISLGLDVMKKQLTITLPPELEENNELEATEDH